MTDEWYLTPLKTKLLRLTAEELKDKPGCRTVHMRMKSGGLVVAEGEEHLYTLDDSVTDILCLHGNLYAVSGNKLLNLNDGTPYSVGACKLIGFTLKDGTENVYAVKNDDIYRLTEKGELLVAEGKGGVCSAVFRERLFTAKDSILRYSNALAPEDWQEKRYGAGYIDLSHPVGKIYDMVPYKERLFLFRKFGITAMRVLGDELNFKASYLTYKQGKLIANSVALCGEGIGYFTDRGFYVFNGAASELLAAPDGFSIDVKKPVKAVSCQGRYFARVYLTSGNPAVFIYDPDEKEGHLVENGAENVAAEDVAYFLRGGCVFRVTERDAMNSGPSYFTAENFALTAGGERTLKSIALEGNGKFSVTITSSKGTRTVDITAGTAKKLRSPLRGSVFSLTVTALYDDCRFCALEVAYTEDEDGN